MNLPGYGTNNVFGVSDDDAAGIGTDVMSSVAVFCLEY